MKNLNKISIIAILFLVTVTLAGCEAMPGDFFDGTGKLAMYIADKPVNDAKKVNVVLEKVEVHEEEAGWITLNEFDVENDEGKFDLLTLRFDEELLGEKQISAGTYNQIRLIVAADEEGQHGAENYSGKSHVVYKDDTKESIFIPSGTQTGLKINHEFTIEEGEIKQLVLDNNVADIMKDTKGNGIILRPTAINVIDKVISGNIEGKVLADTDNDGNNEAIKDYDVIVEALDDNNEVISSSVASVKDTEDKDAGSFLLRGLNEGEYTINAYAVDENESKVYKLAENEQPGGVDEINITVIAGETANIEGNIILE